MSSLLAMSLVLGTAGITACAGADHGLAARHAEAAREGEPRFTVSEDQFAEAVHDLLVATPGSAERARLLSGVVGRQMDRALVRFRSHEPERGLMAVIGGLYLVRSGELEQGTLGPSGRDALREAVRDLALRGDEGRARALYEILLQLGPGDAKADILGHLDALARWTKDELKAGPGTIATGAVESAAVARSLLEPSEAAKKDAEQATIDWVTTALDLQTKFREQKARPSREEVGEAVRALHSGNDVLAEIFLRDADVGGALHALTRSPARDSISPELQKALAALSPRATAAEWLNVLHALTPSHGERNEREPDEDSTMEDRELVRAATFGIALEAYRIDPTLTEAAVIVAAVLQDLGLAEASPRVLESAARAHADARTVSGALTIVLRAMSLELDASDVDAVRRTYAAAAPLLALADREELARALEPNAARVRAMMGEIELEQGGLAAARALLTRSAAEEKSGAVLLSLARIARHDEEPQTALDLLRAAREAPDAQRDPALNGEILLLTSDLLRDRGDTPGSRAPIVDALLLLLKARALGPATERARVEQILARVLDRFGQKERAQQALERAFEATPHDKHQLAATLGQTIARAFVKKDLLAARDGLRRALASELGDEELVYYALWVELLERQLTKPGVTLQDTTTQRIFASIPDDGHWVGALAAFGAGKLPEGQLRARAKTKAEENEATFYQVMAARSSGKPDPGNAGLKSILRGDGVDLMEMAMARELLRDADGQAPEPLPAGVKLP